MMLFQVGQTVRCRVPYGWRTGVVVRLTPSTIATQTDDEGQTLYSAQSVCLTLRDTHSGAIVHRDLSRCQGHYAGELVVKAPPAA